MSDIKFDLKRKGAEQCTLCRLGAPSSLVVGLGLLTGRKPELLAIIMTFATYRLATRDGQTAAAKKARIEC